MHLNLTSCARRLPAAAASYSPSHTRRLVQRAHTFVALRSFFVQQTRSQSAPNPAPAFHSAPSNATLSATYRISPTTRNNAIQLRGVSAVGLGLHQRAANPRRETGLQLFHTSTPRANEPKPPESDQNQKPIQDPASPGPRSPQRFAPLFRRLAESLPDGSHRPTREEFLAVATNFWQRMRIRLRWFAIKSSRPFNVDDWSAFFSWYLVGQTLWILVGTTTFSMVVFWTINSLSLQSYVARGISDYLTRETGVTVVFETAVVPKWKDSRISFKNVYVSRRPRLAPGATEFKQEELNMAMFDLDIDSIDVTLSLWRWLDGKGIVTDAVVKGVRGVVDRTSVFYDPENPLSPADFRHPAQQGDFELESLQLEDVLVTVHQPGHFRPYTASIFRADLRRLRKQWLFYDFLSAESVVGQFDNCLFSVHKPQSIGRSTENDLKERNARMSRFRIDGVSVDHLQYMSGSSGPISWITSGKVDAVLDIQLPRDATDDLDIKGIINEIAANINIDTDRIPGQRVLAKPPLRAPEMLAANAMADGEEPEDKQHIVIDIDLRFRDLKATVPMFTKDLSYVNYALFRPMVAFVNANKTLVPIHCTVVKDMSEFDGAWTMWEAGLIDAIAIQTYDAIAYHVTHNLDRKVKTVSLWGLQVTAQAVVSALRNIFDPVTVHLRDLYLSEYGVALGHA